VNRLYRCNLPFFIIVPCHFLDPLSIFYSAQHLPFWLLHTDFTMPLSMDAVHQASTAHPKPNDRIFQYGTAGVSSTAPKKKATANFYLFQFRMKAYVENSYSVIIQLLTPLAISSILWFSELVSSPPCVPASLMAKPSE
jgi:hypothetical protein